MNSVKTYTMFTDHDVYLFKEGRHYKLYGKFGSHSVEKDGVKGVYFSVWAPNAKKVSVIGNFNNWNHKDHILFPAMGRFRDLGRFYYRTDLGYFI